MADWAEEAAPPPADETATVMDRSRFEGELPSALPRNIRKLTFTMSCYDQAVLDSYAEFIVRAGQACELEVSGRVPLPTRTKRYTVLKSPHIFKQHRSQYETRMHRRLVQVRDTSGPTAEAFSDYVLRLIPPGLDVKLGHQTAEPAPPGLLDEQAVEDCLPRLQSVSLLNEVEQLGATAGVERALLQYDAASGDGAVLALVDTVARAIGEHELTLSGVPMGVRAAGVRRWVQGLECDSAGLGIFVSEEGGSAALEFANAAARDAALAVLDGARFDAGKAGASNVRAAPVSRVELMGLPAGAGAATVAQLCEDAGLSSVQLVRMRRDGTVHVDFGEPTDCSRAAEALKPSGIECLPPKLGPRHQGVLQWLMPYVRPEDHLLFAETVQSFRHGMST